MFEISDVIQICAVLAAALGVYYGLKNKLDVLIIKQESDFKSLHAKIDRNYKAIHTRIDEIEKNINDRVDKLETTVGKHDNTISTLVMKNRMADDKSNPKKTEFKKAGPSGFGYKKESSGL